MIKYIKKNTFNKIKSYVFFKYVLKKNVNHLKEKNINNC